MSTLKKFAYVLSLLFAYIGGVHAHSVAQVQTTKYFHPDTVQMLIDRALAGNPGFQVGDTINYIIEFTPVPNGSNWGVQGYVTDYIPDGVEVISAAILNKDASGNFVSVTPDLPGMSYDGWGARGQATFNAPFNVNTYDATGLCALAGKTNNCNGRMCELQADTGIFFSTDPRTAQFPLLPTRIVQGVAGNGYNINPVRAAQLNPIIGQTVATTHNLWDADQTNGFGSNAAAITALPLPKSAQTALVANRMGDTPFNSGSPVAGPQTGYQLDNTGTVGPWQRVSYAGSRMGDVTRGPAIAQGVGAVCGYPTTTGWNLNTNNPLPSGTNAVRWALGKLQVGQIKYVGLTLRLTAPVPPAGLVNSSEVFGADTTTDDPSTTILTGDNAWMYHIPSVADNNANLLVLKKVIGYYNGATLVPSDGSSIPLNAKVRYRIVYLNSGNANQTNVTLSDTLPCQTLANPVSNITVVSGPIGVGMAVPVLAAGTVATNCTAAGRRTFSFTPSVALLGPGMGGTIDFDVQLGGMAANTLYNVPNTAKLVSTEVAVGVTSNANATVMSTPTANLVLTKTTSTPTVAAGGTATYTITVTNNGTAAASGIMVYDQLPTSGGVNDPLARFSYAAAVSTTGMTAVAPVLSVPPTLTPYSTGAQAANQQEVLWNFGVQTLAVGASMSITYTAAVGSNVPATAAPYYSSATVTYTGGVARYDAANVAPVTVNSTMSVSTSITHYFDTTSGTWVPFGSFAPANAKLRYQIDYANNGTGPVTGANISNQLPCQTAANSVSNVVVVSGPVGLPAPNPPAVAAGNCATNSRSAFLFTAGTIAAGQSGRITFDVQTNAANGNTVVDTTTLSGSGAASAVSEVQTTVQSVPMLNISKTASVTGVKRGGGLTYTLTVSNTGTANATNLLINDWLPSGGAALDPTTRFSFVNGSSVFGGSIAAVTPIVSTPPAATPFNANANAANMQQVAWDFGAQTLAPGASFTITYGATAGTAMPFGMYGNYGRIYSAGSPLTGTLNLTMNSAVVTGTGTLFLSQLMAGSVITVAGGNYVVSSIASNTSLTLTQPYPGPTLAGQVATKKTSQANSNVASVEVSSAVADIALSSLSNGTATLVNGSSTSYTIVVDNNGPDAANGTKILDAAVAGLSKTSVSCVASGGAVCPSTLTVAALEVGGLTVATLPGGGKITLTVNATVTATSGTVTNAANVILPSGVSDGNWSNNSKSDTDTILSPDLSTSTKIWVDTSGGDQNPGDTITYTITVTENGGLTASGVSVTDDIPAGFSNLTVTSIPAGASDASTATGGLNGSGYLNISNITVPANGSVSIAFTVTLGSVPAMTQIDNCASVVNPAGVGAAPCSAPLIVSASAVPATGLKALYLDGTAPVAPATDFPLSRIPTPNTAPQNTAFNITRGSFATWALSPLLQKSVTIDPAISPTVPVTLNVSTSRNGLTMKLDLYCSSNVANFITLTPPALGNIAAATAMTFNIPLAAPMTCAAGNSWVLSITHVGGVRTNRWITITPVTAALAPANVMLPSANVINVDSVQTFTAAYPATTTGSTFAEGSVAHIRAVVSDPFGSFDISGANVTITDSTGAVTVNAGAMTQVADSGAATKTYEYAYTIPAGAAMGAWTFAVTANEGTEGTVTHSRNGSFSIQAPVDHYELSMASSSISCLPTAITVKACADASNPCTNVSTTINGSVTLSSTAGTLSPATVSIANGVGAAELIYPSAVEGASATISMTAGDFSNSYTCRTGAGCTTNFYKAGFIITDSDATDASCALNAGGACTEATVPTQVSGVVSGTTYYLKGVKASDSNPQSCASALKNSTTDVDFGYECIDPDTCSGSDLMTINGVTTVTALRNDSGAISNYAPVSMAFNANGNAPFTFQFDDVGMVTLHVHKVLAATATNTAATLNGTSNSFVVVPHHFDVAARCTTADAANCGAGALAMTPAGTNPAAVSATGASFIQAGVPFTVTITAKNAAGATTPNFGLEATPEIAALGAVSSAGTCPPASSCLIEPAGGVAGTLDGGTFTTTATTGLFGGWSTRTGTVESTSATWDDVGILQLRAVNSDYMASGQGVSGLSGNVGRFYPHHFNTAVIGDANGPLLCPVLGNCVDVVANPGSFDGLLYSGQPFSAQVSARGLGGNLTQNYQGAFARQIGLSAWDAPGSGTANPGPGALLNTDVAAGLFGSGIATASTPAYTFQSSPTVPTVIFLRAIENDLAGNDGVSSLRSVAANSLEGGVQVVSGRMWTGNQYGSELLPLNITVDVQYFDGARWVLSTTDINTQFDTRLSTAGGNLVANIVQGPLAAVNVTNALLDAVTNGSRTFTLASPGVTGMVDLSLNAPNYLLAGSNLDAVNPSNTARATFGVYRSPNEVIYMREFYIR